MIVLKKVRICDYTTIKTGGECELFSECENINQMKETIIFAKENSKKLIILGGGSNVVFPDKKIDLVVLKVSSKGIKEKDGLVRCEAGVEWDGFVEYAINKGYTGVETLSGIPGTTGAVPVQNVGAYGQEVSEVIEKVEVIDLKTLKKKYFLKEECKFSYRNSIFKNEEKDKYLITAVYFKFNENVEPVLKYKELKNILEYNKKFQTAEKSEKLNIIRDTVLKIRESKSMLINEKDINSRSCGSFFTNPIVKSDIYYHLKENVFKTDKLFNAFKVNDKYKISAAYLIEKAGFNKGYVQGGAGISVKHSLALINLGGGAEDILNLAKHIQNTVYEKFGIMLVPEPVIM